MHVFVLFFFCLVLFCFSNCGRKPLTHKKTKWASPSQVWNWLGSQSDCSTFCTRLYLNPANGNIIRRVCGTRTTLFLEIKWKTNMWRQSQALSFLLGPVCTDITTSFATTTSPRGQNEAAHCSAADRGQAKICSCDWLNCDVHLKGNSPSPHNNCPAVPNQ